MSDIVICGIFLAVLPILPHFTPFCQMCDFREKLYNNNKHRFKPVFSQILGLDLLQMSKNVIFGIFRLFWAILPILPLLTPFCKMCDFREKLYNNNRHRFRPFSAKSLDFKSPKTSFLGYFGHI